MTTALTTTLASFLLLRRFGFAAAGMGGVLGMLANCSVMILLTRIHFGPHGRVARLTTAVILPIGAALSVAGGLALFGVPMQHTWLRMMIGYAATSMLIMLAIVSLAALTTEGRISLMDLRRLARLPLAWSAGFIRSEERN